MSAGPNPVMECIGIEQRNIRASIVANNNTMYSTKPCTIFTNNKGLQFAKNRNKDSVCFSFRRGDVLINVVSYIKQLQM